MLYSIEEVIVALRCFTLEDVKRVIKCLRERGDDVGGDLNKALNIMRAFGLIKRKGEQYCIDTTKLYGPVLEVARHIVKRCNVEA